MPKPKSRKRDRLAKYVAKFPIFKTDGDILFCKACSKAVSSDKLYFLQSHVSSATHIEAEKKLSRSSQLLLTEVTTSKQDKFVADLCKAMVASDIPLFKLRNNHLKTFFETYMELKVPSESTVRRAVTDLYETTVEEIKIQIKNKYLWISVDETTDASGRYVANVVLGILDTDPSEAKKYFLLYVAELEKADHAAIARLFDDAVKLLGPDFNKNLLLLFLTDAAPYMVKAASALEVFYPKLTHITCLAHALHRVCEKIRECNQEVDQLIASVKKVFLKAPSRVSIFKSSAPELPLPPEPITTRWGTWLEAANYYAKNFEKIRDIFTSLDSDKSKNVKVAKDLLNDNSLRQKLIYISSNFGFITQSIQTLETRGLPLATQINVISEAERFLDQSGFAAAIEKLKSVLKKNKGYSEIKKISEQISGKNIPNTSSLKYTIEETCAFKYAPITSVEVERTFSMFKSVYRDNRRSFLFENLMQVMLIYCNSHLI